ncbi:MULTISPECIES: hypothetical protein [unclassified Variovorax]|uniref:hypothetical protein n=1 Tax=unclassified Variovorax TaxID=663243 RepID=UPI00076DD101|nr:MULTISPECIES: hypothetical protein [unclassified Variovorax]KWT96710.1 hypothetical protein APY03_2143 [Variovorax sp. WDL1]PNG47303.1 hypothetical protein CHC06_07652 [Variovorax sp. B2]PNG48046.1 hypothetical protein CHC07_07216 [Variovorax sp. B4]VTV15192.1 hypothetical protein WDL1CHR_05627 [Variovorax sp. WDL1]
MNEYELRTLLVAVAAQLGHTDHYLLADLRHTIIDDVLVNFTHDAQRDPKRLILHFDMGELPGQEPLLALLGLMHLNLLSGSKTTGVFALDAPASRLIYAVHFFEPHRSPATAMVNALREHAQKAKAALTLIDAAVAEEAQARQPFRQLA